MAEPRSTMIDPPIEDLLDKVDSKFTLVTLASKRGRQINSYFNQLGEGLGAIVPPQVASVARKPLSIALEEIAAGKVRGRLARSRSPRARPSARPTLRARRRPASRRRRRCRRGGRLARPAAHGARGRGRPSATAAGPGPARLAARSTARPSCSG